jgi:hypothetical protein
LSTATYLRGAGDQLAVGQTAAGHGLEHGDALADVAPLGVGAVLALVDEQLRHAQQFDRHAPHQVRQRVLQPEHAAQHLKHSVMSYLHPRLVFDPKFLMPKNGTIFLDPISYI